VNGVNVQVGDHNRQTITYNNVLQNFVETIERSNLPEHEKATLREHLKALLAHPLTQTAITVGTTLFTGTR
jgi:predicted transcriptional regulator